MPFIGRLTIKRQNWISNMHDIIELTILSSFTFEISIYVFKVPIQACLFLHKQASGAIVNLH